MLIRISIFVQKHGLRYCQLEVQADTERGLSTFVGL